MGTSIFHGYFRPHPVLQRDISVCMCIIIMQQMGSQSSLSTWIIAIIAVSRPNNESLSSTGSASLLTSGDHYTKIQCCDQCFQEEELL